MSVPSPLACPEARQKSAGKDGQSLFSSDSLAFSSTMCSQGLWLLLPLPMLLLLLVQPVEPPNHAAGDTGSWDVLPEALEEQELAPMRIAMLVVEALLWLCAAMAVLFKGLWLGLALDQALRMCWGEEKSQSASTSARPCCQGHGSSEELLQLLLENRALMRRCLRLSSRQSSVSRGKKRRSSGTQKRRRVHFSPSVGLSSSSSSLSLLDMAGNE